MRTLSLSTSLVAAVTAFMVLPATAGAQGMADTIPPATMTKPPVVEGTGPQHVTLRWEPLSDNVGTVAYRVYYSEKSYLDKAVPDPAAQFARYKQVTMTAATIDGLKAGTTYYFAVTGLDAAGNESEYVTTEAKAAPTASMATPLPSASPALAATSTPSASPAPSTAPVSGSVPLPSPSPSPTASVTLPMVDNLRASMSRHADGYDVTLDWTLPQPASTILAQTLYHAGGSGSLSKLAGLLPTATSYVAERLQAGRHTFAIAAVGPDGREGDIVSTVVDLPPTGPSLAILGVLSAASAGWYRFRRRQ